MTRFEKEYSNCHALAKAEVLPVLASALERQMADYHRESFVLHFDNTRFAAAFGDAMPRIMKTINDRLQMSDADYIKALRAMKPEERANAMSPTTLHRLRVLLCDADGNVVPMSAVHYTAHCSRVGGARHASHIELMGTESAAWIKAVDTFIERVNPNCFYAAIGSTSMHAMMGAFKSEQAQQSARG